MGKFSEIEKKRIHALLLREGSRLFAAFGLKKTSVEDITAACGIGKGTFYLFFSAKEDLLLEILNNEEIEMHSLIREKAEQGLTADSFAQILKETFVHFYDHSVSKTLYALDEFSLLFRKISEEQERENYERDMTLSNFLLSKLPGTDIKPEVLMGLLRSVFVSTLHKGIIGESIFNDVIELQIQYIAQGLLGKD